MTKSNDNIFIVEAHFDSSDSSWWRIIGFFTEKNQAEQMSSKWKNFFEQNKKLFERPESFNGKTYEDFFGTQQFESWYDSDEYFQLTKNFSDLKNFTGISIREFKINKDIFIQNSKFDTSNDMISLMSQWNRDYKINNLIYEN